jgi:hypothetical protein
MTSDTPAESLMTEERINRKLAAIVAADVVGYSRLMAADEAGTLAAVKRHRQTIFEPVVAAHNGRIVTILWRARSGKIGPSWSPSITNPLRRLGCKSCSRIRRRIFLELTVIP